MGMPYEQGKACFFSRLTEQQRRGNAAREPDSAAAKTKREEMMR